MTYNNNENKFLSRTIDFRNEINSVSDTWLNGTSFIWFMKPDFDGKLKLSFLCRKKIH